MKNGKNWNNVRRPIVYWIALAALFAAAENVVVLLSEGICGRIKNAVYNELGNYFPIWNWSERYLAIANALFILCSVLGVLFINWFLSLLPGLFRGKKSSLLYRFLVRKEFVWDCVLGVALERMAYRGLRSLYYFYDDITGGLVLHIGFFIIGSVGYWWSILPYGIYQELEQPMLKAESTVEDIWYVVSNSRMEFSAFARLPVKRKDFSAVVDRYDIAAINTRRKERLSVPSFSKAVVLLDEQEKETKEFLREVEELRWIPHMRVLLLRTANLIEASPIEAGAAQSWETVVPLTQSVYHALSYAFFTEQYKGNPLEFLREPRLIETYLGLQKGPGICFDFVAICIKELEVLPAIYALFDYMDLQYRILLSFFQSGEWKWFSEVGEKVGSFYEMDAMLRSNPRHFDTELVFERGAIFTEKELQLIQRYLQNYVLAKEYRYTDVIYLSRKLRNVLRGHGTFDVLDGDELYRIVFKLAMMTSCMLKMNQVRLYVKEDRVWSDKEYRSVAGTLSGGKEQDLSPFFIARPDQNTLLVFNNWRNGTFEYMNYLDGRILVV